MSVPDVIEANDIPSGKNTPNGILSKIRGYAGEDGIASYVSATAQTKYEGDEETFIKGANHLTTSSAKGSYIQIEFKNAFVFPTFYSFKGKNNWMCFASEWNMYGLESSNGKLESIATNKSDGSTFCYPYSGKYCGNADWGTFAVHGAKKAFKYFRITSGPNMCNSNYYRVHLGGFEIFGIYSKDGRTTLKAKKTYCFRSYPISRHIPFYLCSILIK